MARRDGLAPLVHQSTVTLNNAAVKALGAAANGKTELLPALSGQRAYWEVSGLLVSNIVDPYTNHDNMGEVIIGWDNDNRDATTGLCEHEGAPWNLLLASGYIPFAPAYAPGPGSQSGTIQPIGGPTELSMIAGKNLALLFDTPDGALTGGNVANYLRFTFLYKIFNFATGVFESTGRGDQ